MKLCPTGCGKNVKPGNLMCLSCWRIVPKPLQSEVWRTWKIYQRAKQKRTTASILLPLFVEYRKAADGAIAAVR